MPAFNIAQNQQLGNPVGSYFQGKALRLQEQNNERKMQMAEDQERRQQEAFDLNKSRQETLDKRQDIEWGQEQQQKFINDPTIEGHLRGIMEGTEDSTGYIGYMEKAYPEIIAKADADGNGKVTADEITPELAAEGLQKLLDARPKAEPIVFKEGDQLLNPTTGEVLAENEKDFAPNKANKLSEKITNLESARKQGAITEEEYVEKLRAIALGEDEETNEFSPPNANDMSEAGRIIESTKAGDVGWAEESEEQSAEYWLATRIRSLQKGGMSLTDSTAKAKQEFESMVSYETSFFGGEEARFDPTRQAGDANTNNNVVRGPDGNEWVPVFDDDGKRIEGQWQKR